MPLDDEGCISITRGMGVREAFDGPWSYAIVLWEMSPDVEIAKMSKQLMLITNGYTELVG